MDDLGRNHLHNRLGAAERELEGCITAAHSALDRQSWANLASHAAMAAAAAAQVEAFTAALAAAGERP
jgi:hypothetical protein